MSKSVGVLFADISGSTRLYDTLGDVQAKRMIDECLEVMRAASTRYGGRVVKTIGDEVMCVLPDADSTCLAATDMQIKVTELPAASGVQRAIRVGFHVGAVIEENNDVFGDTVNLAARMAGLAKGNQIMTTRAAVDLLSPMLRSSTRPIAALSVKGKGDDVEVCEVLWQPSEELTMTTPSALAAAGDVELQLRHAGKLHRLTQSNVGVFLGRDASCEVLVADRMASRVHARIELRRDKFYLIDQSTNGTFVMVRGEPEMVLRREEVILRASGQIALGHSVSDLGAELVEFTLRV